MVGAKPLKQIKEYLPAEKYRRLLVFMRMVNVHPGQIAVAVTFGRRVTCIPLIILRYTELGGILDRFRDNLAKRIREVLLGQRDALRCDAALFRRRVDAGQNRVEKKIAQSNRLLLRHFIRLVQEIN